jgi:hypothetical protein
MVFQNKKQNGPTKQKFAKFVKEKKNYKTRLQIFNSLRT